jgi:uncharacterized membrane protein
VATEPRIKRIVATEGEGEGGWRPLTSKGIRFLHLLGLTLFLGSILASTVLSLSAPATGDPQKVYFAWRAIGHIESTLTTPGLMLSVLTGIGLWIVDMRNPLKEPWLAFKLVLTVAILGNALILIVPREEQLREATAVIPYVTGTVADMARRLGIFGALNVAMALIAALLGVFKPRLRGRLSTVADGRRR